MVVTANRCLVSCIQIQKKKKKKKEKKKKKKKEKNYIYIHMYIKKKKEKQKVGFIACRTFKASLCDLHHLTTSFNILYID